MDLNQTRRARRRALHFVVAVLGAVLVVPPLAFSPASAAPRQAEGAASSVDALPPLPLPVPGPNVILSEPTV